MGGPETNVSVADDEEIATERESGINQPGSTVLKEKIGLKAAEGQEIESQDIQSHFDHSVDNSKSATQIHAGKEELSRAASNNEVVQSGRYVETLSTTTDVWQIVAGLVFVFALVAPYAIIGGLTQFHSASSTKAERGWTMSWIVVGQIYGTYVAGYLFGYWGQDEVEDEVDKWGGGITLILMVGAPAIGGFVVVGQMIIANGYCVLAA